MNKMEKRGWVCGGGGRGVKRKGEGYFPFRFHFVCPYIQARRGGHGSRGGVTSQGTLHVMHIRYFSLIHVG